MIRSGFGNKIRYNKITILYLSYHSKCMQTFRSSLKFQCLNCFHFNESETVCLCMYRVCNVRIALFIQVENKLPVT